MPLHFVDAAKGYKTVTERVRKWWHAGWSHEYRRTPVSASRRWSARIKFTSFPVRVPTWGGHYEPRGSATHYKRIPNYRDLTPPAGVGSSWKPPEPGYGHMYSGKKRLSVSFSRNPCSKFWKDGDKGERLFPHEFMFRMINSGELEAARLWNRSEKFMDDCLVAERNMPMDSSG